MEQEKFYIALQRMGFVFEAKSGLFRSCPKCRTEIGFASGAIKTPGFKFYHPKCFFETQRGKRLLKIAAERQQTGA